MCAGKHVASTGRLAAFCQPDGQTPTGQILSPGPVVGLLTPPHHVLQMFFMQTWTDRDDLIFAIRYVLARSKIVPKKDRGPDLTERLAKDILAHLERCRWEFHRKPKRPGP